MAAALPSFTNGGDLVAVICPEGMDADGSSPLRVMRNAVDGDGEFLDGEVCGSMLPYDEDEGSFNRTADDVLAELGYRRTTAWSTGVERVASVDAL